MDTVFDLYDDSTQELLRRQFGGKELPAKLASAFALSSDELGRLPDRLFALVGNYDGVPLRKYAMHDAPHLATSIAYFLEKRDLLPQEAQQKVAANLVNACAWYDTMPPESLVKLALANLITAGLSAMAVPDKLRQEHSKSTQNMDAFRAAQASGTKLATGRTLEISGDEEKRVANSESGKSTAWDALDRMIAGEEDVESQLERFNASDLTTFHGEKTSGTMGTELGAQGAQKNDPRPATPAARFAINSKSASWHHCGTINPPAAPKTKVAARHYALPDAARYPIDTEGQVKRAAAYFDEHIFDFAMDQRRDFAVSLAQRAEDLGVKVAGKFLDYAGTEYGTVIDNELRGRVSAFEGTPKVAAYALLLEQRKEIPPPVMVDMLKKADAETGVDRHYGRAVTGFRDPHAAVYAKLAADHEATFGPQFSWAYKGHYVSEDTLNLYSIKSPDIDHVFGEGFGLKLQRDPVAAFKSLPDDQKVLLSRLANAEASRTP